MLQRKARMPPPAVTRKSWRGRRIRAIVGLRSPALEFPGGRFNPFARRTRRICKEGPQGKFAT